MYNWQNAKASLTLLMSLFYRTLVLVMLRWWHLVPSTQRAFYAQQDKQEEKSRRRTEEIEGRGFRILSKEAILWPPLSLSLTLSLLLSPLPILSLLQHREVSQCISWHLLSLRSPFTASVPHFTLLLWYVYFFSLLLPHPRASMVNR